MCRSKDRAEIAKEEIIKATSNPNVNIVLADVAELSQVKAAVDELQSKENTIDCLVCNAGALFNDKRLTMDGKREITFASHLLGGSYYLTKLLMPQLKSSAEKGNEPRVIFVTSGGMYTTNFPSWEEATNTAPGQNYNGNLAYAYAKRGQVILAEEFAKESNDEITFVTAHPGWVGTKGVDDAFGENKKILEPLRNTWEGAEGIAWLMGTSKTKISNGSFYLDRKEQPKHIGGLFMSEGKFTKNSKEEVKSILLKLKEECGI